MGVNISLVKEKAPHLVDLVKQAGVSLRKLNFDPETNPAAVVAAIDCSGSTQELYRSGHMQDVANYAFAAALKFDDDGDVPVAYFDDQVHDKGVIDLNNCTDWVRNNYPQRMGGTIYTNALRWIIDQAGFGGVDISASKSGGLFRKASSNPLTVKKTAAYPTFAAFITDGEPQDDYAEIQQLITEMSQLPIFIQFIGVGEHQFKFLHTLDELDGRLIDNAGFFDAKNATNVEQMLDGLLNEFPEYYGKARAAGLITG